MSEETPGSINQDVLTPTAHLRLVPGRGGYKLQQMFLTADGKQVWRSIPIVEEEDAEDGQK